MKIDVYDKSGNKFKQIELNKNIFNVKINIWLMHKLLLLQRANARVNLAKTLTKWEVRWGWKKPYRQKWTWRARQWSTRNPHYIWWGVAHWPSWDRNFKIQMQKKAKKLALFWYLSDLANKKNIFALESYDWKIKTKNFALLMKKLPVDRSVLFVIWEKNKEIELSSRNIPWVKIILAQYLNPIDLTTYRKLCFVWKALDDVNRIFLNKWNE